MVLKELIEQTVSMAANQQDVPIAGTPNNLTSAPPLSSNSNAALLRTKNQQNMANNTENITNNNSKIKVVNKSREEFYKDLEHFHERRGTPIAYLPKIGGREIDLHALFLEVTERGGFRKVTNRDEWDEVLPTVGLRDKCVNACAIVKQIYRRFLDKYERLTFFGEDPDKMEALEAAEVHENGRSRSSRYPSAHGGYASSVNAVPMSYNYRQHVVNMERRRTFRLSTDLHKQSNYEKLMLSLISPLPNEQDFAINVCTLMANENKLTLKLPEYPKILDILLAHAGVYSDSSLRQLFEEIYVKTRQHSLHEFWHSLLQNMPQILHFETDEQTLSAIMHIDDKMDEDNLSEILNLNREFGTRDFIGHRVLQILNILRNLSFFDDNVAIFAKNRTLLRFLVMGANVRWGNIHIQALDIAGNIASEVDLYDPTSDALSHALIKTLCAGIEGVDRAVILGSLEILFKLCQRDCNEDYINKCLNLKFYETICSFLALNDIMLLIFTLEAIYALTSMGIRSCQLLLQVRGIIDQLVSLISVEAQSYGPDGCVLMRVVETVPGNMLPLVAQNITNLQNATIIQQQQQQQPAAAINTTTTVTTTTPQVQQVRVQPIQVQATVTNSPVVHVQQQQQQQQTAAVISTAEQNENSAEEQLHVNAPAVPTVITTAVIKKPQQQPQPQPQQQQQQLTSASTTVSNVAQTTTTTAIPAILPPATSSNQFTKDDEQYALGWLADTFERVAGIEFRIEQQDMYREYLQHCQKSGKLSIVNQMQFPRLVRTIFGNNVGPAIVRRTDGTEYAGIHYVAIKHKTAEKTQMAPVITSTATTAPPALITTQTTTVPPAAAANIIRLKRKSIQEQLEEQTKKQMSLTGTAAVATTTTTATTCVSTTTTATTIMPATIAAQQAPQQQATTSLIKSLLANKVNQRQQKQKDIVTQASIISQQQQQQQQQQQPQLQPQQQAPIKVTSNTISALVNNPLLQNTLVKVGQTTIKPLNPQLSLEKKHLVETTSSVPPPLAPLSGNNVTIKESARSVIISGNEAILPASIIKRKLDDNMAGLVADSGNIKRLAYDANGSVIAIVSNNNQSSGATNSVAREELTAVTPSRNAANLYAEMAASILEDEDLEDIPTLLTHAHPATQAATPTATVMAQSVQSPAIMSVSDVHQQQQQQAVVMSSKLQTNAVSIPMSRQLLFQTATQSPMKLTSSTGQPTAMATIKTDQGLQTVPVILQQKSMDSVPPQLVLQQQQTPHTTQYVLATNQQGQTYLVAQQTGGAPQAPPAQPTQTVLVTQTPQQQSTGSKTIIILQQQAMPGGQATKQTHIATGQKMIMNTTNQTQPLLLTQRSTNTPVSTSNAISSSPIIINPGTGALLQRQLQQQQQQTVQTNTGRISPTLLSQLNHIPATIKLHQPNIITSTACSSSMSIGGTTATITRVAKPLSLVHNQPLQLQQHASLIQQHIISGASATPEKRQVILTGNGRAIEIKETLIQQQQQQQLQPLITPTTIGTQSALLNSQTIITHSPVDALTATVTTSQPQQQQLVSIAPQKTATNIIMQQSKPPMLIETTAVTANAAPIQSTTAVRTGVISRTASQTSFGMVKSTVVNSEPPPLAIAGEKDQDLVKSSENVTKTTAASSSIKATTESAKCSTVSTTSTAATTTVSTTVAAVDPNWLYICDWRNCPRKKFNSLNDLQHHVCTAHCPEHLDPAAEIFCQWGAGSNLCDGIPRKRYSLMTHLIDRHVTVESLRQSLQRRLSSGVSNVQAANQQPVTIIRNMNDVQRASSSSPALTGSSTTTPAMGSSALQAIKRHTADFTNSRELMEENEGPVTKSIRLTAALILRNLVTYTQGAKRALRRYEPHLSNIALSNVESSGTVSHILFELNN